MKRLVSLAAGLVALGGLGLVTSPAAHAATPCTGTLKDTTINDDIVVPSAGFCQLLHVTVNGNVTVQPNAELGTDNGTVINGTVTADQAHVNLFNTTVNRAVQINHPTDLWQFPDSGIFCGDHLASLTVTNGGGQQPPVDVGGTVPNSYADCSTLGGGNTLSGSLVFTNNAQGGVIDNNTIGSDATLTQNSGYVEFDNNTVRGSVTATGNSGNGEIAGNRISGNLVVKNNCPTWTVSGNTVRGSSTVKPCGL